MTSAFTYTVKETLVEIKDVSVSYGNVPILKNLSATIHDVMRPDVVQGQIVGLLGPSGVGKTTLFHVLAGLIKPDQGYVHITAMGKNVEPGDVGVVAQNYPLLNHRTVLDNLIFAGHQSGKTATDAKTEALAQLAAFNLSEHAHKYPVQLSGGQRQRVAIAQQMICSNHYIIMDEPFSGLDIVALTKVRQMIIDLAGRHEENTCIIVTHDVTSAVSICDTIWLMGRDHDIDGKIIPGARIVETYDLIDRDICWHQDPVNTPHGAELIREIKAKFLTL